jgi:hypothetical protein
VFCRASHLTAALIACFGLAIASESLSRVGPDSNTHRAALASQESGPVNLADGAMSTLASDSVWLALLHVKNGKPQIPDPDFLLSLRAQAFSPLQEMMATLALAESGPTGYCRFPARYRWLHRHGLASPDLSLCAEYQEFLQKAPADRISLIYASENLTQPTSMMGHAMLALSGANQAGRLAEHSVSFLTDIQDLNLVELFTDTLIFGAEGLYQVQPLRRHYHYYLVEEQRSVWRYELALSAFQRQLVHDHIWELKAIQAPYFFHSHNCATLTLDLVAVANPVVNKDVGWVSPADVAKQIARHHLIERVQMSPSTRWEVRMLQEAISFPAAPRIKQWVAGKQRLFESHWSDEDRYLMFRLANAYNHYQFQEGQIDLDAYLDQQRMLDSQVDPEWSEARELDASQYRSPLKTPEDAQWNVGLVRTPNDHWVTLSWLPASHGIEDDNREYFAETELKMGEVSVRASPTSNQLRLRRFQLLSARLFTPYDALTGGLSGAFNVGIYEFDAEGYDQRLGFQVRGGPGLTLALGEDLRLYSLLQAGLDWTLDEESLFLQPEVGGYLYEMLDMKTWVSYSQKHPLQANGIFAERRNALTLSHTFSRDRQAFVFGFRRYWRSDDHSHEWELNWRHYF